MACAILEIEPGIKSVTEPSLVTGKSGSDRYVTDFPFSEVLGKHFGKAWASATGDEDMKFDEIKDVLVPPIQAVKDGKRAWPKDTLRMKWY